MTEKSIMTEMGDGVKEAWNFVTSPIEYYKTQTEKTKKADSKNPESSTKQAEKQSTKQESQTQRVELKKELVLKQIEEKYKNLYEKLGDNKNDKGVLYRDIVTEKYNELKSKIESCKDDKELQNNSEIITLLDDWIKDLEKSGGLLQGIFAGDIVKAKNETISSIKDLRSKMKGENPENGSSGNSDGLALDDKKKFIDKLIGYGIPESASAGLVGFLGIFGAFNNKDGFFAKLINFIMNPVEGFKTLVADIFGDKKATKVEDNGSSQADNKPTTPESKEEQFVKGEITEDKKENTKKYKNGNLEINTKSGKIESIKVGDKNYNLNLKNRPNFMIGKIDFKQSEKGDFIVIGGKELDMKDFIKTCSEDKLGDNFVISKSFKLGGDLEVKKAA